MADQKPKTLVIDNFSGEITPDMIGSLNSGQSPIALVPYGKLPFGRYKKKGLQFTPVASSIGTFSGTAAITSSIRAFTTNPIVCGVDTEGALYNILVANVSAPTPDAETIVKYKNSVGVRHYGGDMYYDAGAQILVISTDGGAYYSSSNPLVNPTDNPTAATFTGVTGSTALTVSDVPRPMAFFLGNLYIADGNNLRHISPSGGYQSFVTPATGNSDLNPTLPPGWIIRDMKVSPDGTYLIIIASPRTSTNDFLITGGQQPQFQPLDSVVVYWNGSDVGYTSLQYFKGLNLTAIGVSSTNAVLFGKDIDGTGIFDFTGNRIAFIDDVSENGENVDFRSYPPLPFSIDAIGKKFFFQFQMGPYLYIYMFDLVTQKLISLAIDTLPQTGSVVGGLVIASLAANSVVSGDWALTTKSKLYYFYKDLTNATAHGNFFHLANYGDNVQGLYPTQFQEFERKIRPIAIRVYTYPTATGNSFIVRLLDLQLNNLFNQTYTYSAGGNQTLAQGALTKIEWPVKTKATGSLALEILPNASTPLFIEKVEIDYLEDLNPSST